MTLISRVIFHTLTLPNGQMQNLGFLTSNLDRVNISGLMYNVKSGGR